MSAIKAMAELGRIGEYQWGMVTTPQALAAGVNRMQLSRLVAGGAIKRVIQGVYRLAGAPEHPHQGILATWLALDGQSPTRGRQPAAVVAVEAATRIHELGDLWTETIDLIVPTRRGTNRPGVRLRVQRLEPEQTTLVDGLPVLTPTATIIDLVSQRHDLSLIGDVLRDGVNRGIVDLDRLPQDLARHAHHYGLTTKDGEGLRDLLLSGPGDALSYHQVSHGRGSR